MPAGVPIRAPSRPTSRVLAFSDLPGWAEDDHETALQIFLGTADLIPGDDWQTLAKAARRVRKGAARSFYEHWFEPVVTGDPGTALVTGYYEPETDACRTRSPEFPVPLHACPPDLPEGVPWATRAEIEDGGLLAGRGLELAWVASELERFFLQVQGSGRLRFADGSTLRIGYSGRNGHAYRSVGAELVRRGVVAPDAISAQEIRRVFDENPVAGRRLLQHNPSYVFFREVTDVSGGSGPLGTMGRSVTAGRSIAVDPAYVTLGAPVWLEHSGPSPRRGLMVAQDTGSAILGPQRADLFLGTGAAAGAAAGTLRAKGRLVVLRPRPHRGGA